jgi:hypothetical protein
MLRPLGSQPQTGLLAPLREYGKFYDKWDAEWIVIRRQLKGHNDTPCGFQPPASLSVGQGLAARRVYFVVSVTID